MSDAIMPGDIQRLILDKLSSPRDHARFSCVCKLWYSIYKERKFPWLVLADDDNENHTYGFLSVYDQKMYWFSAPELEEKEIHGSSHGWLVTIDDDHAICLYDPFSRTCIQLPVSPFKERHANAFYFSLIHKVILSCNPHTSPNECMIMLLDSDDNIAYCKLGDKSWTPMPTVSDIFDESEDIIFYNGNFVIACRSQVFICHIGPEPHITPFGPLMSVMANWTYLVNLEGEVVIVKDTQSEEENDNGSAQNEHDSSDEDSDENKVIMESHFDVYKLDKDMTSWKKENEIGDRILFIGLNESIALSTSLVPNSLANTIYYSDVIPRGEREDSIGIFHLKQWKSSLIYPIDHSKPSPIWLIQN